MHSSCGFFYLLLVDNSNLSSMIVYSHGNMFHIVKTSYMILILICAHQFLMLEITRAW